MSPQTTATPEVPAHGASDAAVAIERAEQMLASGRGAEAIDFLTARNRREPDLAVEAYLVQLRHRAFVPSPRAEQPPPSSPPVEDRFAGALEVPEVERDELDAAVLASAIVHHGCLLVRGLLDASVAEHLLTEVVQAFDAAAAAIGGTTTGQDPGRYVPFSADNSPTFGAQSRRFALRTGSVFAVDAPRALFHVVEAYRSVGLADLLERYLGASPTLSAKKTTLRSATGSSPTEWHQDGAFLGEAIRSANVWLALTPCGVDAPAVELVPRRFDHVVATGTDDAIFDWSVSEAEVARVSDGRTVQPEFAPGDALLFDHLTLHRSGVKPTMTRKRYAIESWFFTPSDYPDEQVPIVF